MLFLVPLDRSIDSSAGRNKIVPLEHRGTRPTDHHRESLLGPASGLNHSTKLSSHSNSEQFPRSCPHWPKSLKGMHYLSLNVPLPYRRPNPL
jgi:hypothetical protein